MPQDYLGRYGNALRKLQALERGAVAPQAQSAFDVGAPVAQEAQSAFQQGGPKPMFDKPMSFRDVYKEMPDEAKDDLERQVTAGGQSVDQLYDQAVENGEIEIPPTKPKTNREKLGYIAEVALRTVSNMGRRGPAGQGLVAWADAELQTRDRRGALEAAEAERRGKIAETRRLESRKDAETRRLEGREDTKDVRTRGDVQAKETRDRAARQAELETQHANAMELEALRGRNQRSDRAPVYMTEEGGGVVQMDGGTARPVTVQREVTETKRGKRGRAYEVRKIVEEQLRALPKTSNQPALDPDTVMRSVGDRIKQLKEDRKLLRALKADGLEGTALDNEIARRATEQVLAESRQISGQAPASPAAPNNPYAKYLPK